MAELRRDEGDPKSPPDSDLVERVSNKDREALSTLYDRYSRLVYSLALRMVERPGQAEEITQDVFMALWQRSDSYKVERGSFSSWILSVTHNRCIDELRKRQRQARMLTVDIEEYTNTLSDNVDQVPVEVLARLDQESILRALDKLPPVQRQSILMAYFQGLTQTEIAEAMGAPLGTVKTRIRLGLQKMRDLLA